MKKKLALFLSGLMATVILAPTASAADTITVDINSSTVIADGAVIKDTVLVYDGSFYLSADALSHYLQTPVNYYKTNLTYYIGDVEKIPETEVPTSKLSVWRRTGYTKKAPSASTLRAGQREISAWLNPYKVKVDGKRTAIKTLRYNQIVYFQATPVARSLKKPAHYYSRTSTLFIGTPPDGAVPEDVLKQWTEEDANNAKGGSTATFKSDQTTGSALKKNRIVSADKGQASSSSASSKEENGSQASAPESKPDTSSSRSSSSNSSQASSSSSQDVSPVTPQIPAPVGMYDIAASGEYAGWRKLMGHDYAGAYDVYFRDSPTSERGYYEIATVPLRKENLYEYVTVTSSDNTTETLTRGQWYSLFRNGCSVKGGEDILRKKYSAFFAQWYKNYNDPAPADIAENYIKNQ